VTYRVIWTEGALDDLRRIGPAVAARIVAKVETYLIQDPEHLGKPLRADKAGLYSYRFGAYRVVYTINKGHVTITVTRVGHRSDVYD
jgi:mRNA interferase RelE/StbE